MTYALQWAEDIAYLYTLEVGDSTSLGDWGHSEYLLLRWAYSHSGRRSAISLLLGRTASLIPGHQMLGFQGSYRFHMYQLYNREWIHTHECISTCLGRVYIVFFFKISTTKTSATIYCCCCFFFLQLALTDIANISTTCAIYISMTPDAAHLIKMHVIFGLSLMHFLNVPIL